MSHHDHAGPAGADAGVEPVVRAVAATALRAYATACPLLPHTDLPYELAREHRSGDSLAEFLVIELTEGSEGATEAERYVRAAEQVQYAIGSLEHVRDQLLAHAGSSVCLPLALAGSTAAEAGRW
jgi:hypothetical protein